MTDKTRLPQSTRRDLTQALSALSHRLDGLPQQIKHALHSDAPEPPALTAFRETIRSLIDLLRPTDETTVLFAFEPAQLSLMRTAVAAARRNKATEIQRSQATVADPAYSDLLGAQLRPLDALLASPLLAAIEPVRTPRLSDFVTKQGVDSVYGVRPPSPDEYDPKHKALLSSSMIPGDIATLRFECDERHRPFGVLFADLDGFKAFNEALGEVRVDQTVLPPVLRAVDAAAYGHGRVYRHGGDEFVILLPNATVGLASALGDQLRHDVGALRFPGTTLLPSVSVGIWLTTPESHLTDLELVERAQEAKKAAKAEGKNRTVVLRESGDGSQKCISAD